MTYAEGKSRAFESQDKIDHEKRETLKMNSVYLDAYKRPKEDEDFI